jgi:hypothetical protein
LGRRLAASISRALSERSLGQILLALGRYGALRFRRRSHRRGLAATSEAFVIGAKGGLDLEVMSLI